MKNKIIKLIFPIVFCVPLLSSCYDYKEPNDISYIAAIGIDETDSEGIYNYTLQFVRPSEISGGSSEEGGSGEDTISLINVDAPSIYAAIALGNHVVSKSFTLSHTKLIVISDKLAKKTITPLLDSIGRSSDIRPTVIMCVSNGDAKDYLESVNPVIEINPVKYYRLIFEDPNASYFPKSNAKELYVNLKTGIKQSVVPLVGVAADNKTEENPDNKSSQNSDENKQKENTKGDIKTNDKQIFINKSGFEYNMKNYIAGELDIEKENLSETIGGAVFKNDKMIGILSNIESELYNILTGEYRNGYSVIYSEKSPQIPVTVQIEQPQKPSVKINLEENHPKISIKISLEGNLKSVSENFPIEKDLMEFETSSAKYVEAALNKFLKKTTTEFNSDIVGFGNYAKRHFLTYDDFNDYQWNEKYKNAEFDVSVDFQVRRTGLKRNKLK